MNPIQKIDLSGQWRFTPENQPPTTIIVPGGGWLKQGFDCEAGTYERSITIPMVKSDQVTYLELGAVNHLAEVWIGENELALEKIHEEVTAFTGQEINLTPYVEPGRDYLLRIFVRAYENGRPMGPHWAEWCESIARGIFREAVLSIYPEVYIQDIYVKTYVAGQALKYDVWITNATKQTRRVNITGAFSSCNGDDWVYPNLPSLEFTIGAYCTEKVTVEGIAWIPGPESYWWPNVPYREGYHARLHLLQLTTQSDDIYHAAQVRFGFREIRQAGPHFELNGVRVNFRGDNLQVANYDRVDHGGKGDAIDTLPGFLPPSANNPGWPKAVDNFLRLNYNVQRQHMGPWSLYMIEVCDELGLMLIGESATRWDGFDMENGRGFHEVKCLQDIILRDRNHPSIVRWSAKNEAQSLDPAYHLELYEAIKAHDDTRPISEDVVWSSREVFDPNKVFAALLDRPDFTWIDHYLSYAEDGLPYFTTIQHNDAVIPVADRPYGLGEADWMRSSTPAGLTWFATTTALARVQGASDVRPYVLLSSWFSSVPGVKTADILTEENRHPVYGEDNLHNPWSHPAICLLQKACHPLLALDVEFWKLNRTSDAWGHFPVRSPQFQAGQDTTREITVFNDEWQGADLELVWDVREGSLSNTPYSKGSVKLHIPLGFRQSMPVTFTAPIFNTHIFLTLRVYKNGVECFYDNLTDYEIVGGEDFRAEFNGEERKF